MFFIGAVLAFTSANRRNQVLTQLEQDKNTKLRFGIDYLEGVSNRIGANGINTTLRFVNLADRDSFVAAMNAFAVGQFAPVAGSFYELHDCDHDEQQNHCVVSQRVEW